ncbi:siderophore biosynthesis protein, partial [Staphylococcus hominis]
KYKHVIAKFFESWVSENWLLPTPLTIEDKATESFKTLDLIHQTYQVEVSVDVRDIHSIRRDCFITMEDAPKITQILQHIFKDDSDLE